MVETNAAIKQVTCDVCGSLRATESLMVQPVEYALSKDKIVTIEVLGVPVIICSECDSSYTDWRGELIRHDAICNYLGRLTPNEIKAIRNRMKMTMDDFSNTIGMDAATLAKLENAELIQSKECDLLLRKINSQRFQKNKNIPDIAKYI